MNNFLAVHFGDNIRHPKVQRHGQNTCLLNLDLTLVPKTFTSFTSVESGHDVVEKLAYDLEYVDVS